MYTETQCDQTQRTIPDSLFDLNANPITPFIIAHRDHCSTITNASDEDDFKMCLSKAICIIKPL